jgi:hypothetical protein
LKEALKRRGVVVTNAEVKEMIKDADASSIDSEGPRVIGKVTFEEFEAISSQSNAKSSGHWKTILERAPLVKGTKKAIQKLHDLNAKKISLESKRLPHSPELSQTPGPPLLPQEMIDLSMVPLPPELNNTPDPTSPVRSPPFHSSVPDPAVPPIPEDSPVLADREQALLNVKWSMSILTVLALLRRVILKI